MKLAKSPGAMAALGASEIDQLGGKVDQQDSPRGFTTQPLQLRQASQKELVTSPKKPREQNRRRVRAHVFWRQSNKEVKNDEKQ